SNSGDAHAAVLDFVIPRGLQGPAGSIDSTKGAYDNAIAYLTGDIVLHQGSSWVAIDDTTGNAPPNLPTTSNAYWQLIAKKGDDGAGGDMLASTYDPTNVEGDAFDMDNMAEGTNTKI